MAGSNNANNINEKDTLSYNSLDSNSQIINDIPHWQQTILNSLFSVLGEESPMLTRKRSQKDQNKQPLSRRTSHKLKSPPSGPSEKQLSAPYVEEVQPEQPDCMRHPSVNRLSNINSQSNL